MKIIIPVYISMLAVSFWLYFQVEKENELNFKQQLEKSKRFKVNETIENNEVTISEEQKTEPSIAEKKVMCLRMFGGGDLSAWETAQAECMLQQSESACECMQILTQ